MKKLVVTGAIALLGVLAPITAVASAGAGSGAAGAATPHRSLVKAPVLFNVPPMLGRHLIRFGLGRLRNMTQVGSTNWSGYADLSDTYQTVSGSWTEPKVTCTPSSGGGLLGLGGSSSATYSSFWVGLDGYTSSSVEQTGTSADCTSTGQPSYYAWYEMYPAGESDLSTTEYPVSPGDVMTGMVTGNSPNSFTLTLIDGPVLTPKWKFSMNLSGNNLARSSAEWVAEAPSSCSILFCSGLPLSNFGTVNFTNAAAEDTAGVSGPISGFTDSEITMQSSGTQKALPGPLVPNKTNTSDSFSVGWQHS